MKTLKGIDYGEAAKRSVGERHTIWELTDHITFWMEEVQKSVKDKKNLDHSGNDWSKMGATDEDWNQSVNRLEAAVNMLVDDLAIWNNNDLEVMVPEANFTFKQMLHGILHHNLYHAGQINILRKKKE